jgi:cytoskeletal protein CcmA (bactofilin family)
MFTRKPDNSAAQAARPGPGKPPQLPGTRPAQRLRVTGVRSVIAPDLTVTGNLESDGEVQIEGEVHGDIYAGRILVGEQAHITGALVADEIVIGGSVQGSIRGNHVTFQSASHIEGDVFHKSLAIEQGAFFEGKSRRADDPMSVQPVPPPAPVPG